MRRPLLGILIVMMSVLSLGAAEAQDSPRSGGELIFLIPSEPPSYDGHKEGTFGTVQPLAPQYNTLLRDRNFSRYKDPVLDDLFVRQSRAVDPEDRKKLLRAFEKRLLDEEAHYIYTLQWHRIIPHSAKVRGWTITPAHFLNQQLDTVWLAE